MAIVRKIREKIIPWTDPRLKRRVHHDDFSRRFPFPVEGITIQSVDHERILPILDQGQVGACTADDALGILGTAPYYTPQVVDLWNRSFGSFDQAGAYRFYNAEENLDGDGPYPPQDNGSSGLTSAKVGRAAGLINGWWQAFGIEQALQALQKFPVGFGTIWMNSMFEPNSEGILTVDRSSGVAGGHQYEIIGYDSARDLLKIAQSWGVDWGKSGFGFLQSADADWLLGQQGDVTIFTPLDQPAPTPTPSPTPPPDASDADKLMADALRYHNWVNGHHIGGNAHVAHAGKQFLLETGL